MPRRYPLSKRLSWRIEYAGYRTMEALLRLVTLPLIDRAGSVLGAGLYALSPHYRRLAIRNLRLAFGGEMTLPEIRTLARRTCQRTIANFLGTLKTTVLPTRAVSRQVSFSGLEKLEAALAQGRGAVLVLGHMGNWEILNRLHHFLPPGTPAGGIYQPLKNPLVNALLLRRREQDGSRMFSKKGGFHGPAGFVKSGGLLIVVADQKTGRAGTALPFFNRLSSLSPLPALLARKAGAPVLAAGIETTRAGHWRVVFQPLPEKPRPEEILSALETLIRRSPADYLWLHDRWRLSSRRPLSLRTKKRSSRAFPDTLPLRVLLLAREEPDHETLDDFLAQRAEGDLPLSFETLASPHHADSDDDTWVSATPEQLTALINRLDQEKSHPLEAVLVLSDDKLLQQAAQASRVPAIHRNGQNLPLRDFLAKLSAPSD
ncbi:lysophospholipid acyltransferase family protein [Roseibacillus ishigakijimensis]|uniref:Lysophospholipid acyltransferase family protein n=1 Tax=Roseibacillus ishigakijimensis TaxID=454146 RepID=A0A934VLL6_9BACT|nr:lysophospholipid acyltransferase family protein [Roseibacillus ishigakijimensis]MBK1834814.1 lysophospholipid acyltransferase family protein [Roseibacillus ishigakijimensis]